MKRLFSGATLVLLSACSPQADKIYTVDGLVADNALLAKVLGECRNTPGELGEPPNCHNAEAADGKLRLERMRRAPGG
ncbi:EexN family lipoprotein [Rhizobium bangladeshense]|uniref:EexN family lipoprotein n=1 Tax=Rhizobium bangladeshense TaxID=1138189 RepID=UPI0007E544F6|nr:EexN family lipoprotein [Rhizobium bangladeshense]